MPSYRIAGAALALILASAPMGAEAQLWPRTRAEAQQGFAPLLREATPAVVSIYARRIVEGRTNPFVDDPFFRDFFGDMRQGAPRVQNALGSGVILSADGLVVSNYHVVGGADDIRIVLNDRREYAATILLADQESDLAVLRVEGVTGLPALSLADSDGAEVGDLVLAIGNPFGVGQTVTSGIVSALGRSTLSLGAGRGYFLQTDASINPGNSGGALVDMAGNLLGINSAILTRGGGSNGVGFAIPSNLVARVLADAKAGKSRFDRPWAGLTGQPVDMAMASALGLDRPEGVLISELHPQSPFAAAGLLPGDVILSLDDNPVTSPQEMMYRLAVAGAGQTARVGYVRSGAAATAKVALVLPPDSDAQPLAITNDVALRGLTVAPVGPTAIAAYDLPLNATGVVVTAVADRAAQSGLAPGDVILAINSVAVNTPEDVAAEAFARTRTWTLDILRKGQRARLVFRT